MTLFLPKNLPPALSIWYYCFDYNETHMAMPLSYGSLLNHHKSANVKSANVYTLSGLNNNVHFQVRGDFQIAICNVLKICTCTHARANMCIHTCTADAYTHITSSRP